MIVSGFTFVRNAVLYDYPVVESITSMLPLCDEVVVCLGNSTDTTEALVRSIDSPKIKIINSVWDESLRKGGRVLAIETNKALQAIRPDADWALYLQADEVPERRKWKALQAKDLFERSLQINPQNDSSKVGLGAA